MSQVFFCDDHEIWYFLDPEANLQLPTSGDNNAVISVENHIGDFTQELNIAQKQLLEEEWNNIAEKMQQKIEFFSNNSIGTKAGNLFQNLKEITKEKYDYSSFLEKFTTTVER